MELFLRDEAARACMFFHRFPSNHTGWRTRGRAPSQVYWMGKKKENNPKSGLASPHHTANLSVPVLGCIEANFCKQSLANFHFATFCKIYKIMCICFPFRISIFVPLHSRSVHNVAQILQTFGENSGCVYKMSLNVTET